jgi:predicted nucleic acid-binding protein
MIVLDTNVVSEAMKPEPHPAVRAWLNDQAAETLYLSSVTLAELLFGIGRFQPANARTCWHKPLTV